MNMRTRLAAGRPGDHGRVSSTASIPVNESWRRQPSADITCTRTSASSSSTTTHNSVHIRRHCGTRLVAAARWASNFVCMAVLYLPRAVGDRRGRGVWDHSPWRIAYSKPSVIYSGNSSLPSSMVHSQPSHCPGPSITGAKNGNVPTLVWGAFSKVSVVAHLYFCANGSAVCI